MHEGLFQKQVSERKLTPVKLQAFQTKYPTQHSDLGNIGFSFWNFPEMDKVIFSPPIFGKWKTKMTIPVTIMVGAMMYIV